jgi:hypothetical protein
MTTTAAAEAEARMAYAREEEEHRHRQMVAERKAHGRWLQTQVKCIYCLQHTAEFSHTLGLPFCQNDHFLRYSRGEHSHYLRLAQEQLGQTTDELAFINSHFLQGNQDGLYEARDALAALRERVIDHAVDYKLSVARYRAYEQEVPARLSQPHEALTQAELLHVIARLIGSLETCIQQTDTLAQQIDHELLQLPAMY